MKRVDSGEGKSEKRKFPPGEKPVRLKERKVEEAEETNKKRRSKTGERTGRNSPYMVANEATDAPSDNR